MPPATVVVGGGVVGSASAFFLAQGGARVTVVERDPGYARASSSLSASSIRQQFSTAVNIRLSQFGIEFLRGHDLGLREPGYLYLAPSSGVPVLEANHAVQRGCGADVILRQPDELAARFPWLSLDGVALGSLGLSGEGWFDGPGLAQHFRQAARALGATFVHAEASSLDVQGGRVTAVRLSAGDALPADAVVNAAGPAARHVAAMAGITLPVEARKRCIFVVQCRDTLPGCPLVIDTTGVWFRPEGDRFLAGWSPPDDPERLDLDVEHDEWDEVVWPALAARVPAFEAVKVGTAWAGHYDYNTFDQNGLVGIVPAVKNLVFANGFSGHGMQQAPGVGRAVAELVLHGGFRTLDLHDLDVNRVAQNRPLRENCII